MNLLHLSLSLSFTALALLRSATSANAESRKLLWGNDIQTDEGHALGRLEIYDGEEAINVVDAFVQNISSDVDIGNSIDFRSNLFNIVCESDAVACSKKVPLIYRKLVNDEDGKNLGAIEIYENEEVIDAVVRFIRESQASVDEIMLKNYMFEQACGLGRVLCTRNVAVVYSQIIKGIDELPIGRLAIFENEEPADKVFKWCRENNVEKYSDCKYICLN